LISLIFNNLTDIILVLNHFYHSREMMYARKREKACAQYQEEMNGMLSTVPILKASCHKH